MKIPNFLRELINSNEYADKNSDTDMQPDKNNQNTQEANNRSVEKTMIGFVQNLYIKQWQKRADI